MNRRDITLHVPDPASQLLLLQRGHIDIAPNHGPEQLRCLKSDAAYKVPGDVWRALEDEPRAIALIDGVFEHVPSVWHHELVAEDLRISEINVDAGPTLKRWRARARGRATRVDKRTAHVSSPARNRKTKSEEATPTPTPEPEQYQSPPPEPSASPRSNR